MSPAVAFSTTHNQELKTDTKQQYVFVVQLHNGTFVIGQASNACKRISAINSGLHPFVKKTLQVNRVIGIKAVDEQRNLPSVVAKFCEQYGDKKVLVVWRDLPPA